jgi:HSP20 family protein
MRLFQRRSLTWSDALETLREAELAREHVFAPRAPGGTNSVWAPPIDVLETEGEVLILTAMPGVDPDAIEVTVEGSVLTISGRRTLPIEFRDALIHRLELPQGCLERRIVLPAGGFDSIRRTTVNNCLVIRLAKSA